MEEDIKKIVELLGFKSFSVESGDEQRFFSIHINDESISKEKLPGFIADLNKVVRLFAKKKGHSPVVVDVNNYRRERERLIVELARAAARQAAATKSAVQLPAMNAYERRLIHSELSIRPDVRTESVGEGKERRVVITFIEE
jgi:spoIIIJ-associated protein